MDDMTTDNSTNSTPDPAPSSPAPQPSAAPNIQGAPQVPQQAPPVGGTQPQQPQAPVTTPATPPTRNQQLHGFVSSVLSGITNSMAGKGQTKYTTDASGRVIADPSQPKETTGDKLRRIGANALTGLAAGSQAGGKKSGLADALSGLGAGAEAQKQGAQKLDDKSKQEARENEEAAQQKMLRMHDIARGNALTASTFQHMIDEDQDRDPSRKQHMDWAKAAEDAGAPVQYMDMDQLNQMRQSDPETIGKYQILPIGMKLVTDPATGQPVVGSDGQPKMVGQVALIDGLHDGQLPAPASFVSDLQKYGKYAGITGEDNLKAGDSVDMSHFIKLANGIQEGKKKELEGWAKPNLVWTGDKHDIPMFQNSNTNELRSLPGGAIPNAANKPEDSKAKDALVAAETDKNKAQTQEALANAALARRAVSSGDQTAIPEFMDAVSKLPPQSQALLKAVPVDQQGALLTVAAGDGDLNKVFPTRVSAKSGQLDAAHAATLIRVMTGGNWTESLYTTKQQLNKDFTTGKEGQSIRSFNQFLNHANDLKQSSDQLVRTGSPILNTPLNRVNAEMLGKAGVPELMTYLIGARDEWQTFIKSGHAMDKNEVDESRILMSDASTMGQIAGVLHAMGTQAVGRLDPINETYKTTTGTDWPNLIYPQSRKAAENLGIGNQIGQYKTGGTLHGVQGGNPGTSGPSQQQPQSGPQQATPQSHQFNLKAWAAANPGKDAQAAAAAAQKQGYQVIQ